MSNNSELVLPITTFQRHVSTFSGAETEPVIFINSAKKEVRRSYSVFTKNKTSVQNAPATAADPVIQYPQFLKGASDGHQSCIRFIHKYQDRQFPENYVAATIDGAGGVTGQTNLLAHVLTNIPPEKTKNSPYLASLSKDSSVVGSVFEEAFMIVQDFRSSDDKGVINSLNMAVNSSPLILEIKMNKVDAYGATMVQTYLELSSEVVIASDGGMSIVTKAAL